MELSSALAAAIPTFESERLRYRAFREDDFEPLAGFFADDVSRFYGGPCDRVAAWRMRSIASLTEASFST